MNIVTAYQSDTGKNFRTPTAALLDEFHRLQQNLKAACGSVAINGNLTAQIARLRRMIDELEAKGQEYKAYFEQPKQHQHAEPAESDNVIPLRNAA